MLAAINDHRSVVSLLLEKEADVNIRDKVSFLIKRFVQKHAELFVSVERF
jgi:hypothetical protein